jgi:hypothetical protein
MENKMNAKQLIATAAMLIATGSVFAQQTEYVRPDANFVSTKTRAEVAAELKASNPNSAQVNNEWVDPSKAAANTHRSRDEVRAEGAQAQKNSHVSGGLYFGG